MEWNEESIARLRAFWAEGLSTAEIGRRMGVSKNAIVGKAHPYGAMALVGAPRAGRLRVA
jgi:GcrA cell cycle regulator